MNGLSDALTIGLVLALVFGALFFYLYSRLGQVEKRISLTENILLDLKMATENTIMSFAAPPDGAPAAVEEEPHMEEHSAHIESTPASEEVNDEDFYKQVLQQAAVPSQESTVANVDESVDFRKSSSPVKMDVNYESMTLKELKALAKQRGLSIANATHKKDVIDVLKRQDNENVIGPLPGSFGTTDLISADEGFPVELGSSLATESRNAE